MESESNAVTAPAGAPIEEAMAVKPAHLLRIMRSFITDPTEQEQQVSRGEDRESPQAVAGCELWDVTSDCRSAEFAVTNGLCEILALVLAETPGACKLNIYVLSSV